jgi:hypothetical protein
MKASCADAPEIDDDLHDAPRILGGVNRSGHESHIRVCALAVCIVPSAVTTNDEALHGSSYCNL